MTRLAILSRVRLLGSVSALGVMSLLGCSGSSNSVASSTGGVIGLAGSSSTSADSGGTPSALSSGTSQPMATGGAAGSGSETSGVATGGTGMPSSSARTSGGATLLNTGGATATPAGGATAATGGIATTAGSSARSGGGTKSNGTGGTANGNGGTRASGGTTTSASAGLGGASSTATGGVTNSSPSPGCNASGTPASGRFSIQVGSATREYIVKLPTGYDPKHPYRLIFAFHGRQYSAQSVADGGPPGSGPYYGIESEANGTAIFVAPQALSSSWNPDADLAFVTAMVSRFESELCIDENRIFSTGFSMGAIMTIAIGCSQANVFRAIAPMSGSLQGGTCAGSQAIAYWASHGTNDPTIPIANGEAARDVFVTRNGCDKTGTTTGSPTGCVNYTGCDDGYPTTWCTFDGVHEPPPFAGQAIWAFFSQF